MVKFNRLIIVAKLRMIHTHVLHMDCTSTLTSCLAGLQAVPDLDDVQEEELTAQVALPPRYPVST